MKKITFKCDGSSGPDTIEWVIKEMKQKFPYIKASTYTTGKFRYRCDFECKNEDTAECLKYLKGFASHATYLE